MASSTTPGQARRRFLLAMAGTGTLLLAGCQTGPGPLPPGPGPGPVTPGPIAANRHLVAVIVPLSGGDAPIGQSIANAANLALADTGEKSIRLNSYDSAGRAVQPARRVRRCVTAPR
ncbi:hypothetical protein [Sphingomonas rhizophila]|uniref:hypothetical protein n=1 Tax=Sphingomonas rhizophila TaxID=2071607 RepID=UPI001FE8F8B5|nr:hypothetical protein [Sphingomonas rhizophila]